jgi:hypothetical protein
MARNDHSNADLVALGASDIRLAVIRAMQVRRAPMIWGPPGIGKSELIAGIAKEQGRPIIDMRLLIMEPTDLKGIPYYDPKTNTMRWAPSSELPKEGEVNLENAVLFLDEINAAPQSVQAAAYQLILNRRVGEYRLPDGVSIVAAGNRETDKAVTFRMPSALANRFAPHLEMKVSFDDWETWAIDNKIHPDVVGFLKAFPAKLFDFNPKNSGKAFATPRSWTFVSDLLDDSLSEHINTVMVQGTVGLGVGGEFMQHRRISGRLPDPRDILSGKIKKLDKPDSIEISAKYALAVNLCYTLREMYDDLQAKKQTKEWNKVGDTFLEFMMVPNQFSEEMVIMAAIIALRKYNVDFDTGTETFNKFFDKYHKWILNR